MIEKPEAKRKALPNVEPGIKFVRWITLNVMKHVHPDRFLHASKAKLKEMQEVFVIVERITNELRGHE